MPRLIFKCHYIRGGGVNTAAHLENYVGYVATRQGVERLDQGHAGGPATRKQQELAARLTKDFPLSRELFEYEDYRIAPTQENASAFISRAIEENLDQIAKRENYLEYIAQRPRVQKLGAHGLFSSGEQPLVLSRVAEEVAQHPGNVWLPIISLRREDAARLGYDNAARWKTLLSGYAPELAKATKIPLEKFRWYAAFHDEGSHPHVHMVCYSTDGKSGYLTENGIAEIRSALAKEVFRQELTEVYRQQTQRRDDLSAQARARLRQLIQEMRTGTTENERVGQLMLYLADQLKTVKGKKQYGYLKPQLKSVVDEIVDELERDPRVAEAYELWYELREEVLRTYKDTMPERVPLSRQKEFKQIKNTVIQEAAAMVLIEPMETELPKADESVLPEVEPPEKVEPATAEFPSPKPNGEQVRQRKDREAWRQYRVDWKLLRGDGVQRDVAEAQKCFEQAAHLGSPQAQYQLAKLILSDDTAGAEQTAVAVDWLTGAAEAGLDYAQYALGKLYRDGMGVERDTLKAVIWFTMAAEQDNEYAAYALGKLFLSGECKDIPAALRWLEKAAGQNNQYAQYALGKLYLAGTDIPKDAAKAIEYLTDSAKQGNQYAQYQLGKLHLLGRGVGQDREAAEQWFRLSAEQGNEYARWFLDHWGEISRAPSVSRCVAELLRAIARMFEEQAPQPVSGMHFPADSKLRRRIREKKIAMGHKPDDHEDQTQTI